MVTDKQQKTNIERFEKIVKTIITRIDAEKFLAAIKKTDFYSAPASTRFHLSCQGGLLQHSLNVYDCLMKKLAEPFWRNAIGNISDETIAIVALFHDFCKISFYVKDYKNQKKYCSNGSKKDENGNYEWVTVEFYTVNDRNPYGHGEKSVMMLEPFIKLSSAERYAIRWHMGFSEPKEMYQAVGASMEMYPLVLALNEADMEASHIMERE